MAIEEMTLTVSSSNSNSENSKDSKSGLSTESSQVLTQLSKEADGHKNWCIAIWVKDVAAEILKASEERGKAVKIAVWNDGESVEMIADSSHRRLEMVFASRDGGHWIDVSEVTSESVKRHPPSKRPIYLTAQLRWLLGTGE